MSDCIEYEGARDRDGYGRKQVGTGSKNKVVYAHRHAYEAVHGPLSPGLVVRHTCDNPPCVNVNHLISGTVADNNWDMSKRGRHWALRRTEFKCGHPIVPKNIRIRNQERGWRECLTCYRDRPRRRKKEAA